MSINYYKLSYDKTNPGHRIDFPRTEKINWVYVIEKLCATFGVFFLMIVLAETYLYPIAMQAIQLRDTPFYERAQAYPLILMDLILP